jgi:AcrR family transcriptional regulator
VKYDLTKKTTRGAQRTLAAFSDTMFALLMKKPFAEITVNELCQRSNYPRATFYNYFDDKYDLLNYCWYCLGKQIRLEEYKQLDPDACLYVFFDRFYDLAAAHVEMIQRILKFNSENSLLLHHFQVYFNTQIDKIFRGCPYTGKYRIPYDIVAKHYSNTILLIFEECFLNKRCNSKSQAHDYLQYLLGSLAN